MNLMIKKKLIANILFPDLARAALIGVSANGPGWQTAMQAMVDKLFQNIENVRCFGGCAVVIDARDEDQAGQFIASIWLRRSEGSRMGCSESRFKRSRESWGLRHR